MIEQTSIQRCTYIGRTYRLYGDDLKRILIAGLDECAMFQNPANFDEYHISISTRGAGEDIELIIDIVYPQIMHTNNLDQLP